jgi:hypothetical protein
MWRVDSGSRRAKSAPDELKRVHQPIVPFPSRNIPGKAKVCDLAPVSSAQQNIPCGKVHVNHALLGNAFHPGRDLEGTDQVLQVPNLAACVSVYPRSNHRNGG